MAKLRKHLMNEFGVKVSVNDVVIKAVALALRMSSGPVLGRHYQCTE